MPTIRFDTHDVMNNTALLTSDLGKVCCHVFFGASHNDNTRRKDDSGGDNNQRTNHATGRASEGDLPESY